MALKYGVAAVFLKKVPWLGLADTVSAFFFFFSCSSRRDRLGPYVGLLLLFFKGSAMILLILTRTCAPRPL